MDLVGSRCSIRQLAADAKGATSIIESLILVALIGFVVIVGVEQFGGSVLSVFEQEQGHVAGVAPGSSFSFDSSASGALGSPGGALGSSSSALGTPPGAAAVGSSTSPVRETGGASIGSSSSALVGAEAPTSGGIGDLLAAAFEAVLNFLIPPAAASERHGPWIDGGIHEIAEGEWTEIDHHHALPHPDKRLPEVKLKNGRQQLWDEAAIDLSVAGVQVWDKAPLETDHDFWAEQQVFQPRAEAVDNLNDYREQGGKGRLRDFVDRRNALRSKKLVIDLDGADDFVLGYSTEPGEDVTWVSGDHHEIPRTPELTVVVIPTDVKRCSDPVARPDGPACASSFRIKWSIQRKGVEVPRPGR